MRNISQAKKRTVFQSFKNIRQVLEAIVFWVFFASKVFAALSQKFKIADKGCIKFKI